MYHFLREIYILPLQSQALGDAKTRARSQKRQSTLWLAQVSDDCVSLFGSNDHGILAPGCPATEEAYWIRFLGSGNQAISLAMAIDQRHDASQSVESWIFKLFVL